MNETLYQIIFVLASVSVISILYILRYKILGVFKVLKSIYGKDKNQETGTEMDSIYELIKDSGYAYDPIQDIFYSRMNAWQRDMGYTRLFDEAAASLNIIMDCEPIYFKYNHKIWLIEFWKGQYGMTTGCEIGVYNIEEPDIYVPSIFNSTALFNCVSNSERLYMVYYLEKDGKLLFRRRGYHWWLTGFRLGLFSWPSELTMHIAILFTEMAMLEEFVKGLKNAGYKDNEIIQNGAIVRLRFEKPHTPQPFSRTALTDHLVQRINKKLCDRYQEITKDCVTMEEKILAIKEKEPELFRIIMNMGKTKKLLLD